MAKRFVVPLIALLLRSSGAQEIAVLFSENPVDSDYYDSSWGYASSPSRLELIGDKLPVETQRSFHGAHSLRLNWRSAAGGDWAVAVAAPGWKAFDVTRLDTLEYRINAPAAIGRADLPHLRIEDVNNRKSRALRLADFFSGVDADTNSWQRVAVPLNAFEAGSIPLDLTRIKTLFHQQGGADGTDRLVWIDEVRMLKKGQKPAAPPAAPESLSALGGDGRIDLSWRAVPDADLLGFFIYRSAGPGEPFERLNRSAHEPAVFCDFFSQNGLSYYYRVTSVDRFFQESEPTAPVPATSRAMNREQLITSVQQAAMRYFYHYGHPVSGLARERKGSGDVCTSGGTGFGLLNLVVGAERGFLQRQQAAERTLKILEFLQNKAQRYHGAWAHWIHGATGQTVPFSTYDNGGDLVETAYLVQGLLIVRQYFDGEDGREVRIRELATRLWQEVEWDWYRKTPATDRLFWHWSPDYGFRMNMAITGFNEAMIVYLLAIASPAHPVPASLFHSGWARSPDYVNGNSYYGILQWVGPPYGGPLFFTHYSFLGFDPRVSDRYCNYFENNRNITRIQHAYCVANPQNHKGYGDRVWGLTASDDPWGYSAHDPVNDNGTITPTAPISAMPYTPELSAAAIEHLYRTYGQRLWGEFGFRDAFNLDQEWFAGSVLAIDQGTMAPMIENSRTGLLWRLFSANAEIGQMMSRLGMIRTGLKQPSAPAPSGWRLGQNYPNPFNPSTLIPFHLKRDSNVTLAVYNVLGEQVDSLARNLRLAAGSHCAAFRAPALPGGLYFVRLEADGFRACRKMVKLP